MNVDMLIDGAFVAGEAASETVIDPRTGLEIIRINQASAEQIDAAVAAARKAFESWSRTTPGERSLLLLK